ncbi:hypothetical protein MC885_004667, partial [Smutsia gigantea]
MSCRSYRVSSGRQIGNFSSCSAVTPPSLSRFRASSVSCRSGPGFRGLGGFGSRSVIAFGSCPPRMAAVGPRPIRCGVGFGAGSGLAFGLGDSCAAGLGYEEEVVFRANAENEFVALKKYEEMRVTAGQHSDNLRNTRDEINELTRVIQRLKAEIEHTKAQ